MPDSVSAKLNRYQQSERRGDRIERSLPLA